MNRREFFLNSLAVSGAAATIGLLDSEKLLAIPPRTIEAPPTAWNWDGTAEGYLDQLIVKFSEHMRADGRELVCIPELEKIGYRQGAFQAVTQLHTGWRIPYDFRLGLAGLGEEAGPSAKMVYRGAALCTNHYDPIASINRLAEHFAQLVIEDHGRGYGQLYLPQGVHTAIQRGPFRFISTYDIGDNLTPVRIDMMVAARLPHA